MHNNQLHNYIWSVVISLIVISVFFIWQGDKGVNLADEGFLWYGVQQVMKGEVPLRDFMSYDPGRYYWSAAMMDILNDDGIYSLRLTVAVFQALGLFAGLLLISQSIAKNNMAKLFYLIMSASILIIWMFPRHKLFDISLSIFLMTAVTFAMYKPSIRRFFITGLCVGLIAIFGRNHGVYAVAGTIGAIIFAWFKKYYDFSLIKGLSAWFIGIIAGYSPIILMLIFIPDFANAFWKILILMVEQKTTNVTLPIPWPWTVDFAYITSEKEIRQLIKGLLFIAILLYGLCILTWLSFKKKTIKTSPVLIASAFSALPYAHFAYSRADVYHLAQSIFPFLVGCLVLLATIKTRVKWLFAIAICIVSLWFTLPYHPGWQCRTGKACVKTIVSGSDIIVRPHTAKNIVLLKKLSSQYTPNGESFLVVPFWPGAYPLLKRNSPVYDIFPIHPRLSSFEKEEIKRIKAAQPKFALIIDWRLDGREDLRFKNTHPLTYQYITDNFERVPYPHNPSYQIFKINNNVKTNKKPFKNLEKL